MGGITSYEKKSMLAAVVYLIIIVLLLSGCGPDGKQDTTEYSVLEPENTWAVLMEMNEFPQGWSGLPVDYINSGRMRDCLVKLGCPESHVLTVNDEILIEDVEKALEWLEEKSKKGDTLIFYMGTHGRWIRSKLAWNRWFPERWKALEDRNKILLVDSCFAEEFIKEFSYGDNSGIYMGACSEDETSWWGLEEEGLPIIGSVWTYYLTEAVFSPEADANGDKMITMEEAFRYAVSAVQEYMKDEVFEVEEFLAQFPHLVENPGW